MAKIIFDNTLPALDNGEHPYAVEEIVNALLKLEEEGTLNVADLRAIASKVQTKADDRHAMNYHGYGGDAEHAYGYFGL